MIKLVLSDMDNTLVPLGARHATERTIRAIHEVLDAGVHFGPATGRDYFELLRFFSMDGACFRTGVLSNGKRIRLDGHHIKETPIPHDLLVQVDQALRPEDDMFLVCFPKDTNLLNPAYGVGVSSKALEVFERRISFNGGCVDEVPEEDMIAASIACVGGPDRQELCRRVVAEKAPDARIVSPIPEWFDVLPPDVSKATGLDVLVDALGISLDEVAVFGDSENDLEILSKVKYSVAVANATHEVKRVARYRVGASAEEGMADALFEVARAARAGEMPSFLLEPAHD